MPGRAGGAAAILAAAALWGSTGTVAHFAPAGASPVSVGAARIVAGGALLLAIALCSRPPRSPAQPRGREIRQLLAGPGASRAEFVLGAASTAGYQLSFFSAVRATGVAVGTVVAIGSAPVFTGLLSRLTGGTALTGRWMLATAGAIAGCTVLVTGGRGAGVNLGGVGLALLAGLCYAVYAVTAARLVTGGIGERAVMGALFGGGAVLLLPVLLASQPSWLLTVPGALVTAQLGIMTTAVAYLLYGRGLRTVPAPVAVTLGLAEPVVAALLALVVLGERLSVPAVAGLILVGMALAILIVPGGQDSRRSGLQAAPGASTPPGRTPLTPR